MQTESAKAPTLIGVFLYVELIIVKENLTK
jgi:hypothetical protein